MRQRERMVLDMQKVVSLGIVRVPIKYLNKYVL